MKLGAPVFGVHIFNTVLKFVYLFKTDVPLCGSGCEYVLMSTGTAEVSLIEAPSSGVPGGGF